LLTLTSFHVRLGHTSEAVRFVKYMFIELHTHSVQGVLRLKEVHWSSNVLNTWARLGAYGIAVPVVD